MFPGLVKKFLQFIIEAFWTWAGSVTLCRNLAGWLALYLMVLFWFNSGTVDEMYNEKNLDLFRR